MTEAEVAAADVILRRHGTRYVVIGGQAVARQAATTTHDVDVMVATADYGKAVAALRGDPDLVLDWETKPVTCFRIRSRGGVPLDVVNAAAFSGTQPGQEFFDYLVREGSYEAEGIAYATAEMVWYTRLLTKRWRAYAEKIVTNVIDGLPPDLLRKVEEIARRFGTDTTIEERIAYVRAELARPDIKSLIKPW